jgi:serine/threonine protein kinase
MNTDAIAAGNQIPDSLIGKTIDAKYRIESILGEGGMGTVYLSTRLMIGDTVAVKILHSSQVSDPQAIERFRREAQAAARLKHQNAVTIYDFGVSNEGLVYLVMELAEGQSLRDIIKQQGPVTPSAAAEIMSQVCAALDEAHRQNIVHRDLKPDNIIVAVTNNALRAKVLDFGIAKMRDLSASNLTQTGAVMGTPYYMSPEHCMGEELDHRSDIYSLGIVLFEMLAGVVPFNSPISTAVVVQHVNQAPPSLRALNASISAAVEAVVMRALAKRRDLRQQTAVQLAQELIAAAAAGRPLTLDSGSMQVLPSYSTPASTTPAAIPVAGAVLAPTIQMTSPPVISGARAAAPVRKRLPLKLCVALVIVIAVVAAAGYWWLKGPPKENELDHAVTAKTGTLAITPQFSRACSFSEGLALVTQPETRGVSYIDKTGKVVFTTQAPYPGSNKFSDGLATICFTTGNTIDRCGFIDKTGTVVVNPTFISTEAFSEGRAQVRIRDGELYLHGYIDKTGKVVITPQFSYSWPFSEGLAAVGIGGGNRTTGMVGFIDKTGKFVINPQFEAPEEFSEGLAAVRAAGRWGFIDKTGKMIVAPQFDIGESFSEGLAAVRIGDDATGKWGYIDSTGKMVVPVQFDGDKWDRGNKSFSEGLAAVRVGDAKTGRWGFIDKTGKMVIALQFDWAQRFSEGLAAVRIGDDKTGRWGFIDKTGNMVVAPQFAASASFSEGLAAVRIGDDKTGRWGYIYR